MTAGLFAVALTIVLPAVVSALSQAWSTVTAMNAMSRQPEAADTMRGALLLALAFMEALTLFAFVIAFMLLGRVG
ncbi:MAG: ATP synthase F0 subunit C [Firmicutes bacterium]|jgi:F-type H+-transporting ATPase subunit c|nr:ATP synthase F0 subunit C [Bacillota bacterium]